MTVPHSYKASIERIARYLRMREEKPLRGIDADRVHCIHTGTEWEAELRLSDLRALLQSLSGPSQQVIEAVMDIVRRHVHSSHFLRIKAAVEADIPKQEQRNKNLRWHLSALVDQCERGNLVDDHGHEFKRNQALIEARGLLNWLDATPSKCRGFLPGADPSKCCWCGVKVEAHER
jgi:hypothetical protein